MTAIEHRELRGITIKNLIVTILSTASIVASVMTTYFGLKSDIQEIRVSQQTEAKINNIRIKIMEDQVSLLQKEVGDIKRSGGENPPPANDRQIKITSPVLLSANKP